MKSLRWKTVFLLLTIVICSYTSSLIFANGIEKRKSIGKEYFSLDTNTKLTYETTFGDAICTIKPDGVNEFCLCILVGVIIPATRASRI